MSKAQIQNFIGFDNMEKSVLASSCLVAAAASGLAIWALVKLYETRSKLKSLNEKYNNPKSVQKCLMHQYGSLNYLPLLKDLIPNECEVFHKKLATLCKSLCIKYNSSRKRVLDVGCSTGVLSFYLSEHFDEVIATDTSYFMTITCQTLQDNLETTCLFPTEGGFHVTSFRARIPSESRSDKINFWNEDASNLDYTCGSFSCVVVANTLSELSEPNDFLKNISNYVDTGGLLILAETYHWSNGPEIDLKTGGPLVTFEFLKQFMQQNWTLLEELNLPFYFAVCERRAEVGNSHVTVWKRKSDI